MKTTLIPMLSMLPRYLERRFRKWLMRRQQRHGTGYKQYPDAYLYETLGLYQLPTSREAVLKAKV